VPQRDLEEKFSAVIQIPLDGPEDDAVRSVKDQLKNMGVTPNDSEVEKMVRDGPQLMDPGDIATWVTASIAVLALIVSVGSAVLSWKSLRWERLSAEAATRSAEAAERANRLAEMA
jgi:hypothetical protein